MQDRQNAENLKIGRAIVLREPAATKRITALVASAVAFSVPISVSADTYKVSFSTARADDDGALRLASVEATLSPMDGVVKLNRTASETGLYNGWAGFVTKMSAQDSTGNPIELVQESSGVWRLNREVHEPIVLRYAVNLQHDRFMNEPGDDELAYARPYGVMWTGRALFVEGKPSSDIKVEFTLPNDWTVSAPWPRAADDKWVFAPQNTELLLNAAFLAGDHHQTSIEIGSTKAMIALGPPVQDMARIYQTLIQQYFNAYAKIFGSDPSGNFLLIGAEASFLGGGVMGRTISLSLNADATGPQAQLLAAYLVAHEGFHLWNAEWGVQDATRMELEWLSEGMAEYYTFLTSVRLGLIDTDAFLRFVSERYTLYLNALESGNSIASAGRSKHTSQKSYDLVYSGGMMAWLLIDLEIRKATNNEKSLDDVIGFIHMRHAGGQYRLTAEALLLAIKECTGVNLGEVYARSIMGRDRLKSWHALDSVGLSANISKNDDRAIVAVTRTGTTSDAQMIAFHSWTGGDQTK